LDGELWQVLVNGEAVETVDWTMHDHVIMLRSQPGMNRIDLLVENCGRVNFADFDSSLLNSQRKGCCIVFTHTCSVSK